MSTGVTNTNVFDFMGTPSDVRTTQGSMITSLITDVESEIEKEIDRKISSTAVSNVLFQNDLNCVIIGNKLYLKGIYRDLYSISSIYENGTSLTAVTDYNDSNDYYLDTEKGCLIRNTYNWATEAFAIKISGNVGIGGASSKDDIKRAIIMITAARSGLWKNVVLTEQGELETLRTTIPDEAQKIINRYKVKYY